jgi:GT2 family glycosyltransferase
MSFRLTVGIVTYRRAEICLKTIELLVPLLTPEYELIIVEQGGNEVAQGLAQRSPKNVRCYNLAQPSMTGARNYLIQRAQGDIVLFVDDDVEPSPTLLSAHVAAYQDPQVGGVAGRILSPETNPNNVPRHPGNVWIETDFEATEPAEVPHARGCNMSFRRELLLNIGGYDTNLRPPFFFREDSDVGFRIRELGYKIAFVPAAALFHLEAKSGGARGDTSQQSKFAKELRMYRMLFIHYFDSLYFLVKHFKGRELRRWVAYTHRHNVGWSRYPWRLAAKNACFAWALVQAFRIKRKSKPPYFKQEA